MTDLRKLLSLRPNGTGQITTEIVMTTEGPRVRLSLGNAGAVLPADVARQLGLVLTDCAFAARIGNAAAMRAATSTPTAKLDPQLVAKIAMDTSAEIHADAQRLRGQGVQGVHALQVPRLLSQMKAAAEALASLADATRGQDTENDRILSGVMDALARVRDALAPDGITIDVTEQAPADEAEGANGGPVLLGPDGGSA